MELAEAGGGRQQDDVTRASPTVFLLLLGIAAGASIYLIILTPWSERAWWNIEIALLAWAEALIPPCRTRADLDHRRVRRGILLASLGGAGGVGEPLRRELVSAAIPAVVLRS